MYLAMNRFTVPLENAAEFEELWLSRDSKLHENPGFVEFHMLKGPEEDGAILYASHTVWADEESFVAWTKSEAFRAAHSGARSSSGMYLGPPELEVFETVQALEA